MLRNENLSLHVLRNKQRKKKSLVSSIPTMGLEPFTVIFKFINSDCLDLIISILPNYLPILLSNYILSFYVAICLSIYVPV